MKRGKRVSRAPRLLTFIFSLAKGLSQGFRDLFKVGAYLFKGMIA